MKPVRAVGAHLQGLVSLLKISTLNVLRSLGMGFTLKTDVTGFAFQGLSVGHTEN